MGYKKHEILEQKMCKELDGLEEKYQGGQELSESDLKRMDILWHALKSKATYDAMKEAKEYEMQGGMSYDNRGGNSYANRSYNDGGYSGRRSMEMGPGYSGHYPPMMPMPYYNDRQW